MADLIVQQKELVQQYLKKGILPLKNLLNQHTQNSVSSGFHNQETQINTKTLQVFLPNVEILFDYQRESGKLTTQNFISYFNNRFKLLESILKCRQELNSVSSIARIQQKQDKDNISLIAIIYDKHLSKNENIILDLEDRSGSIKAVISKSSPFFSIAKDLVPDEVIGITGTIKDRILFISSIILPDVPIMNELKKSPDEVYAVVLSDLHVGSSLFLENEFNNFLEWINGNSPNSIQKELAAKTKYIFIVGDLVDGVGIYPRQENELNIKNIYDQYEKCTELLSKIPEDKTLIVCPGNHDALRLSEPQPKFYKDFSASLWNLKNAVFLSNPCTVKIHQNSSFPGFIFLLYHGYSYDYYGDSVESIRTSGRSISDRVELVMKFLLQKRHLAPTHTSTLYIPDEKKDCLVIEQVPDFILSGHIHKSAVLNYRGVTLICGSCWQAKTQFQERVGHEPLPCIVPLINLHTREVKQLDFNR